MCLFSFVSLLFFFCFSFSFLFLGWFLVETKQFFDYKSIDLLFVYVWVCIRRLNHQQCRHSKFPILTEKKNTEKYGVWCSLIDFYCYCRSASSRFVHLFSVYMANTSTSRNAIILLLHFCDVCVTLFFFQIFGKKIVENIWLIVLMGWFQNAFSSHAVVDISMRCISCGFSYNLIIDEFTYRCFLSY